MLMKHTINEKTKASQTRKQILSIAKDLLQSGGFNSFSFQHLADNLGIKKPSIHYHFKSKEALGLDIINGYRSSFLAWQKTVQSFSPRKRVLAYLQIFQSFAKDTKPCPMGVLSSELNSLPESMQSALHELHNVQKVFLIACFNEAKQRGEMGNRLSTEAAVDLFLSATQGGLLLTRIRGDKSGFFELSKNLMRLTFKGDNDGLEENS